TVVTLTATPETGSTLTGWDGAGCSGTGDCVVTITATQHVTATFTLEHALNVATDGNGSGTVTSTPTGIDCGSDCTATFTYGTVVTLTATPETGSTLTGWDGAGCSGTDDCAVTITAAQHVTATFTLEHVLNVTTDGNGSGTVTSTPTGIDCGADCTETLDYGTVITLTATAGANSIFSGWGGACSGTGKCVVTMVEAKAVTATFDVEYIIFLPSVQKH
ncbi:MAG: hypothetical protein GY792_37080, partial [Gammaproteobacteria bacterium]|nr:hypothetical protein [Gammaproteobacteria bacterium]